MAGVVTRKTPGVYVTEVPAFPPSIVPVETAVPAFIGYTEKPQVKGTPPAKMPVRIGSLVEFEAIFGGSFAPQYDVNDVTSAVTSAPPTSDYDFTVMPAGATGASPPAQKYYKLNPATPASGGAARYNLYNSMRLFYANGGSSCYVVSVGDYTKPIAAKDLTDGLDAVKNQFGPTMLVVPDAVLLTDPNDFKSVTDAMLAQCDALEDRVAIFDVFGTDHIGGKDKQNQAITLSSVVAQFRANIGEAALSRGMAYFPFLVSTVIASDEIDFRNFSSAGLATLKTVLEGEADRLYPAPTDPKSADTRNKDLKGFVDTMTDPKTAPDDAAQAHQHVIAAIPLLKDIESAILDKSSVLPPSPAMAGVYTAVDYAQGVWNAPANVALAGVETPTYKLSAEEQEDLNVPLSGKAIDAIREFTGRGTVVWGARTLDGNSNDYRYIQVRRTLIYIEQSIRAALNQFVFAPNDGNTWTTVVSMISGFLQSLWSKGGLLGATPAEAFSVTCGLGTTMTAADILEGYMRVQVVLQMIRPAEFIELTFKQKMGAGA